MSKEKQVELDDHDLIRRMALKDADALDALYTRYHRVAFALVLRIVGNKEDAEDVLTEVFWQAWQQSSRYDPSRGKPVAWLLTIARTRSIDRLRARGRHQTTSDVAGQREPFPAPPTPDPFVLGDTRDAVRKALQALPEQQRIPLEMAYFEGMSHSEIATALGQPLGTVKDRIRAAMMHLKKRLRPYL